MKEKQQLYLYFFLFMGFVLFVWSILYYTTLGMLTHEIREAKKEGDRYKILLTQSQFNTMNIVTKTMWPIIILGFSMSIYNTYIRLKQNV